MTVVAASKTTSPVTPITRPDVAPTPAVAQARKAVDQLQAWVGPRASSIGENLTTFGGIGTFVGLAMLISPVAPAVSLVVLGASLAGFLTGTALTNTSF